MRFLLHHRMPRSLSLSFPANHCYCVMLTRDNIAMAFLGSHQERGCPQFASRVHRGAALHQLAHHLESTLSSGEPQWRDACDVRGIDRCTSLH